MHGIHGRAVGGRERGVDGFLGGLADGAEDGLEQQQVEADLAFGLEQAGARRQPVGFGHLLGFDALGDLADALAVDLRGLLSIVRLARFDAQGLVRGEEFLVELVIRIEGRVVEDELHDLKEVGREEVHVCLAHGRKVDVADRPGLLATQLGQGEQLDRLHLLLDALEALRLVGVRHDAEHGREEIPGGLEVAVHSLDLLAFLVALGALGEEEHRLRLFEIALPGRQGDVHVVVVAGDHERHVLRIKGRHLEDDGLLAQVEHTGDVERIVVRPGDQLERVVLQLGVDIDDVPAAVLHRPLVVHVVHGDVLPGALDEIFELFVR